jgi:hypothetical protein
MIKTIYPVLVILLCLAGNAAYAKTLAFQMLGQSEFVGNAADIDKREGTKINFSRRRDDPYDFACFEMPLYDMGSGVQIGVTAYSFFVTPGGTLVNRGKTSLRALIPGFGDGGSPQRTHATGSIPSPGDSSLVAGTRRFGKAEGQARVSGAVNPTLATPFFDCLWKIELQ